MEIFAVWFTTDAGATWSEVSDLSFRVLKEQVRQIRFLDAFLGWAVGDGGIILRTMDGGLSWNKVPISQTFNIGTSITAMGFVSPEHGWIGVSDAPEPLPEHVVLSTTDAGKSWNQQREIGNASINDITFFDREFGLMGGGNKAASESEDKGVLYKTNNGGLTWKVINTPASSPIKTIYLASSETGWFRTDYEVYRTRDGGNNWQLVLSYLETSRENMTALNGFFGY